MNYDYKTHLLSQLTQLQEELGLSNYSFTIEEEQDFIKRKDYDPNTLYIVIKYLTDSKQLGATVQPVQLLILTEQNSLEVTKILFDTFSDNNNWKTYNVDSIYVKQQYSQPVVLSNFNPALYGYRSVMYVSAQLVVMEDYADVTNLTIDDVEIEAINFNLQYTMSANTQQKQNKNISTSVKNISTISIALTIPPIYSDLINKVCRILRGNISVPPQTPVILRPLTGNEEFTVRFEVGGIPVSYPMRLTSAILTTAPNQVPSWQLGFAL